MSITSIKRDWGVEPAIVRITATDDLAALTTTGFLAAQADNIAALNAGAFEWADSDYILCFYDSGTAWGFFERDATTDSLVAAPTVPGSLSDTLADGDMFVGSALNVATGVTPSGDLTVTNAGVFTVANNAITSAKISPLILKYTTVAITAAQWNGMYAAPKLILAAGGANTFISVERAVLAMTFVSAAYADGGVVGFQYDSTAHGAGVAATNTEAAADFFAAASTCFSFAGVSGNTVAIAPFSTTVNKGIYLSNLTGAFTTGDSTWVCHIWYRTIPTV